MSSTSPDSRFRLTPMRPRDPNEPNRVASSLELFFDLVFVVAVSVAGSELHHALAEGRAVEAIPAYLVAFFAIWWAWMNFTWFATSFATDDWLYRILTFVQMAGVLVVAAGIGGWFARADPSIMIAGYVLMRVAMCAQWLRAAHGAGARRSTTLRYAGLIAAVQVLWLATLALPAAARTVTVVVLIVAEVLIPIVAERAGTTPWHPHHITERYSLFALILLGESLLASANAIFAALQEPGDVGALTWLGVRALVITAALWWIYFWPRHADAIGSFLPSLVYGYAHFAIFAAAGALSVGIGLEVDLLTGSSELSPVATAAAISVPIAVFVLGIWSVALRRNGDALVNVVVPVGAALVLLDPLLPAQVTLTPLVLVVIVVVLVLRPPVDRASRGRARIAAKRPLSEGDDSVRP